MRVPLSVIPSRSSAAAFLLPIALCGALSGGCAGRKGASGGPGTRAARRDPNMITREQITATHYNSAYEVVEALHSTWLRPRGPDSFSTPGQVLVYIDDSRLGGVETLRSIAANTLASIHFIDAVQATARWGIGHTQGVIYLSTQVGP